MTLSGTVSAPTWGTGGIGLNQVSTTYIDTASSGTVATVVADSFASPVFSASSTTTYTNAATLYIGGSPIAGSNASFTNSYALFVNSGGAAIGGGVLLNGNISKPAWGTTGGYFRISNVALTDTTSSGTVSNNDVNVISTPTLAASTTTTYTTAVTLLIQGAPSAGTNVGITNPYALQIGAGGANIAGGLLINGAISAPAWGATGLNLRTLGTTYTDTTSSGTVPSAMINALGVPTIAATTTTTYTNAANLYIAGAPAAGTNVALTNSYGLYINGGGAKIIGTLAVSGNISHAAWGTTGAAFSQAAATYTDTSSAGAVAGTTAADSFGTPTFAASTTTTYTTAANLYIAGAPAADTNVTPANKYALYVASGLSQFGSSTDTDTTVATFQNNGGSCSVSPATTGGVSCSSDMTLKKNITNLSDGSYWAYNTNITPGNNTVLSKILSLNPVAYNWDTEQDTDPKHTGFIAQEVQQVFPDLVTIDSATHTLSLDYTGLIPYTIEAIKEMDVTITSVDDLARDNSLRTALAAWLGDAGNGIEDVFAKNITSDVDMSGKVKTNELCVGATCVSQQQFLQMVDQAGIQGTQNIQPSSNTPTSGTTPAGTDSTSTSPTLDTLSGPSDGNSSSSTVAEASPTATTDTSDAPGTAPAPTTANSSGTASIPTSSTPPNSPAPDTSIPPTPANSGIPQIQSDTATSPAAPAPNGTADNSPPAISLSTGGNN